MAILLDTSWPLQSASCKPTCSEQHYHELQTGMGTCNMRGTIPFSSSCTSSSHDNHEEYELQGFSGTSKPSEAIGLSNLICAPTDVVIYWTYFNQNILTKILCVALYLLANITQCRDLIHGLWITRNQPCICWWICLVTQLLSKGQPEESKMYQMIVDEAQGFLLLHLLSQFKLDSGLPTSAVSLEKLMNALQVVQKAVLASSVVQALKWLGTLQMKMDMFSQLWDVFCCTLSSVCFLSCKYGN